jgi:hypothetical protein
MPPAAQDQLAVLKSFPRHPLKVSFQRKAGVRLGFAQESRQTID